jgi:hypothetical protein
MKKRSLLMMLGGLLFLLLSIDSIASASDKVVGRVSEASDQVYSDAKSVVSTVHQDVKEIIPVLYGDAKDLFTSVGKKLGVAAEAVWVTLVRQQRVKSIALLLSSLSLYAISIFFWHKYNIQKLRARETNLERDVDFGGLLFGISLILTIASSLFLCYHAYDILTGIINPEYGAMKDIYQFSIGATNAIK